MNDRTAKRAWNTKGATLSDKTAREEYDLTEREIIKAINAGKLRYRENSIYGNPFLRLFRSEVEKLVEATYGAKALARKKAENELKALEKNMRTTRAEITVMEERKAALQKIVRNE